MKVESAILLTLALLGAPLIILIASIIGAALKAALHP